MTGARYVLHYPPLGPCFIQETHKLAYQVQRRSNETAAIHVLGRGILLAGRPANDTFEYSRRDVKAPHVSTPQKVRPPDDLKSHFLESSI
jgi:hypothetical protein